MYEKNVSQSVTYTYKLQLIGNKVDTDSLQSPDNLS